MGYICSHPGHCHPISHKEEIAWWNRVGDLMSHDWGWHTYSLIIAHQTDNISHRQMSTVKWYDWYEPLAVQYVLQCQGTSTYLKYSLLSLGSVSPNVTVWSILVFYTCHLLKKQNKLDAHLLVNVNKSRNKIEPMSISLKIEPWVKPLNSSHFVFLLGHHGNRNTPGSHRTKPALHKCDL